MESGLLNGGPPFKRKQQHHHPHANEHAQYELPKGRLFHLITRIGISIISILVISLFVKSNSSRNSNSSRHSAGELPIMTIDETTTELLNSFGFPPNSKELVYSSLEKWGFHLADIADAEVNTNYNEADLDNYKYSKKTYKNILFSFFEKKETSQIGKNALLYTYLEILQTKEINSFYDFLHTFLVLQDLNCLPVNYKGVYTNGKLFLSNHMQNITKAELTNVHTLINEGPYLYVTFHGGRKKNSIHNICKFSRDGYYLGSVLLPFEEKGKFFNSISLRGLLLHQNGLYVTDSFKENSKIFHFSESLKEFSNRRAYVSTFIEQDPQNNPLMIHPYGIKKYDQFFYVSSQNTGTVLRFDVDKGVLGQPINLYKNISNGLVIKLNKNEEIRGLDFDSMGKCYVSNKQTGVQIYDQNFNLVKIIPVFSPISILFHKESNHIFVGSSKTHDIKEYDINNFELIKVIKHPLLRHVAGIIIHQDSIFAVSQRKNKLLEFSISTTLLRKILVDDFADVGERVMLSPT
ncbi:conserved Plasmodium protein, unknown function [Plasmodium vivax]|uniref:Uncharacterized protein n=6 Tax=Plasmodium vivax TaxID=5855 RepID=A5K022_PLAVS|nr:hypothetical protein, conserved [Plasmodium vivax]KMZ78136.1 hypothetical protein PVIIG_00823 [Plasmodium vivax India VII]KMZ84474.1 hypothetical protein PVBG_00254 [Plasmodium vivax Brazil I]KMZ90254.1 hypothetical protein PVMG_01621 [Plasmodium vivax Mauritania I]KMZ96965.1 hypothetical protein PVNG_01789 [Plasmodium vivax North Korean]EDL47583.1 hypothetical protein, conserved [Plasmodium vivax]|eukprot:XP_001617310.1 hypothetical protein [Plasmodium vivax Sal-1]